MEEEETECDSYFNGDWYSLTEECQCITASIEYIDMGNGYYGGANGCKSCDGWACAECYEGFMMNEWNSCVRMETTSEPSDADACELCTQNSCLGNGACLLIEGGGEFTCEVDPNHFTSQSVCDRDYGHWCSNCYECPEVMCMMYCEYGYVQDEYGCDTCVCNDMPEEESSMEEGDSYQDVWSESGLFHMMGNCDVVGDCVSSNNFPSSYGNNEYCSISVMQDSAVSTDAHFMLETCCDNLIIDGIDVEYRSSVPQRLRAGSYISFSTDYSVTQGGFQLCFSAATQETTTTAMASTDEPEEEESSMDDADACELCTQNSCLGNGACLLIES